MKVRSIPLKGFAIVRFPTKNQTNQNHENKTHRHMDFHHPADRRHRACASWTWTRRLWHTTEN
jgi:hypothetical protein